MALAGLFSNIGVANAAEAKAVINAILNQNTENLTPKQKSMLGTGIYRDISEQLDVKDAAGNQITRTSKVVLPSGQIVESRHSPRVAASEAATTEESEEPSQEEQLQTLYDYISSLSDEEFAEVMGYDDKSSMFNAWSRIVSGYAPTWASDILGDSQTDGEFGILGSGGIRWHILPDFSPVITQEMILQTILDDLNRRIRGESPDQSDAPEGADEVPQDPVEGPQDPVEVPQDPVEGPQDPVEGPQDPVEGPQDSVEEFPDSSPIFEIDGDLIGEEAIRNAMEEYYTSQLPSLTQQWQGTVPPTWKTTTAASPGPPRNWLADLEKAMEKLLLRGGGVGIKIRGKPGGSSWKDVVSVIFQLPIPGVGSISEIALIRGGANVFVESAQQKMKEIWEEVKAIPEQIKQDAEDTINDLIEAGKIVTRIEEDGTLIDILGDVVGRVLGGDYVDLGEIDPALAEKTLIDIRELLGQGIANWKLGKPTFITQDWDPDYEKPAEDPGEPAEDPGEPAEGPGEGPIGPGEGPIGPGGPGGPGESPIEGPGEGPIGIPTTNPDDFRPPDDPGEGPLEGPVDPQIPGEGPLEGPVDPQIPGEGPVGPTLDGPVGPGEGPIEGPGEGPVDPGEGPVDPTGPTVVL